LTKGGRFDGTAVERSVESSGRGLSRFRSEGKKKREGKMGPCGSGGGTCGILSRRRGGCARKKSHTCPENQQGVHYGIWNRLRSPDWKRWGGGGRGAPSAEQGEYHSNKIGKGRPTTGKPKKWGLISYEKVERT